MMYDLVSVGRSNMDLYSQDIGAAFADITGFDATVGGSPTNIAIGVSRLGLRSVALTAVGDDRVGEVDRGGGTEAVDEQHAAWARSIRGRVSMIQPEADLSN